MADAGDVQRMKRIIARLKSVGVQVREIPGWEKRGATFSVVPTRGVDHHDASSRKSGEWGALGVVINGRPGISGPLSQAQVARCLDGVPKIAIVAAGRANHAGKGGPLAGIPVNSANSRTYGNEKANDGVSEPYTAAALYATAAWHWACAIESGQIPAVWPIGHNEWAAGRFDTATKKATGRKSDPRYNMVAWRKRVGSFKPNPTTALTGDDLPVKQSDFDALMDTYFKNRLKGTNAAKALVWNQEYGNTDTSMHNMIGRIDANAQQIPVIRALVDNFSKALEAVAKGQKFDEAKLLDGIRRSTAEAIVDAGRSLQQIQDAG